MSSNPNAYLSTKAIVQLYRLAWIGIACSAHPLAAQDDNAMTPAPSQASPTDPIAQPIEPDAPSQDEGEEPLRIDLTVTVPRAEANQAQLQECKDRAEAGTISGEILVCRQVGNRGKNYLTGNRSETQKRYAQETAFKGSPRTPNVLGLPDNGGGIGIGGVPPKALIIDVEALPAAPAGSDADRIARGLPPLGQDENLTEEEIRKRREKLGLPAPAFENRRGN